MIYFAEIFHQQFGFLISSIAYTKSTSFTWFRQVLGNENVLGYVSVVLQISVNKTVIEQGSKF